MIGYGGLGRRFEFRLAAGRPLLIAHSEPLITTPAAPDPEPAATSLDGTPLALRWAGVVVVGHLVGTASPSVSAQTQQDVENAREERTEVRNEAAAVADRIDQLGDRAEDLAAEIGVLEITISAHRFSPRNGDTSRRQHRARRRARRW